MTLRQGNIASRAPESRWDESGAADKNLRYLVGGDEIQTVHYATAISSSGDELTAVPIDTIRVTPETALRKPSWAMVYLS